MNKHNFKFQKGFETIQESECIFPEARKIGNKLANEHGKITFFAYNDKINKWQFMGEFLGDMKATDAFNDLCRISNDFYAMIPIAEGGAK